MEPGGGISDTDIPAWTALSGGVLESTGIFWVHAHQQYYLHAEFKPKRGRISPSLACRALG
jgi:hypothetical protein